MKLIDTDILIDHFHGHRAALDFIAQQLVTGEILAVSVVIDRHRTLPPAETAHVTDVAAAAKLGCPHSVGGYQPLVQPDVNFISNL